jgi:hypothetical protein
VVNTLTAFFNTSVKVCGVFKLRLRGYSSCGRHSVLEILSLAIFLKASLILGIHSFAPVGECPPCTTVNVGLCKERNVAAAYPVSAFVAALRVPLCCRRRVSYRSARSSPHVRLGAPLRLCAHPRAAPL